MNFLIIVGPSITGRRESEVEIRIRTYSDSITSVHQGAGRIEDYINFSLLFSQLPLFLTSRLLMGVLLQLIASLRVSLFFS